MKPLNVKDYADLGNRWINKFVISIQKSGALRFSSGAIEMLGLKECGFVVIAQDNGDYFIAKPRVGLSHENCFFLRKSNKDVFVWYPRLGKEIVNAYGIKELPARLPISKTPNSVDGMDFYLIIKTPI